MLCYACSIVLLVVVNCLLCLNYKLDLFIVCLYEAFLVAQTVKNLPAMQAT